MSYAGLGSFGLQNVEWIYMTDFFYQMFYIAVLRGMLVLNVA